MIPALTWLAWAVAAYLIGAIPFGVLIARAHGQDLRAHGSGNVGATNVGRVLGRKWGIICFGLDVAKGLAPVLLFGLLARDGLAEATQAPTLATLGWLGVAAAAVTGHIFPVYLGFRGGKGVATGLGVVLGMWPVLTVAGLAAAVVWLITVKSSGYVSLGSIVAALSLPVLTLLSAPAFGAPLGPVAVYVALTALLAGLVVYRHRSNIANLRAGTESKAGWTQR